MPKESKPKRPAFAWMQPVCSTCWFLLIVKIGRRTADSDGAVQCCYCKHQIKEKEPVFLQRVNPGAVPYPSIVKEDV